MDLFLMRHGRAEHHAPSDAERALTAEGVELLRGEALGLKRLGVSFDAILASPMRRAQQTAAEIRDSLDLEIEIGTCRGLASGEHDQVLIELGAYGGESVLLVGHLPLISELASRLLYGDERGDISFEPGSLLHLSIDRAPQPSCSALHWHLTPKQLLLIGEAD
ncbi:MAG: phosphohistidine phosphatase SixA [Planctomycetota bacterium]